MCPVMQTRDGQEGLRWTAGNGFGSYETGMGCLGAAGAACEHVRNSTSARLIRLGGQFVYNVTCA